MGRELFIAFVALCTITTIMVILNVRAPQVVSEDPLLIRYQNQVYRVEVVK